MNKIWASEQAVADIADGATVAMVPFMRRVRTDATHRRPEPVVRDLGLPAPAE